MSEVMERCTVCGAMVDDEDLFCANCGTETPDRDPAQLTQVTETSTCCFRCSSCGASMSYDASSQTLRCPFCGSEELQELPEEKTLAAKRIIPFIVTNQQVLNLMRTKLGS
ncbi:MAG: zinc-ribbon domain-containing protein, partial [Planctomycetaceae bacterium]|nr:zinc-ribbon domain-containing protein [Planctomycetaceae bacterium]